MIVIVCLSPLFFSVNGGWSDWTLWGPCDRSCGTGSSIRYRECNSPKPSNGGAACSGSREQSKPCNIDPCPGKVKY